MTVKLHLISPQYVSVFDHAVEAFLNNMKLFEMQNMSVQVQKPFL